MQIPPNQKKAITEHEYAWMWPDTEVHREYVSILKEQEFDEEVTPGKMGFHMKDSVTKPKKLGFNKGK